MKNYIWNSLLTIWANKYIAYEHYITVVNHDKSIAKINMIDGAHNTHTHFYLKSNERGYIKFYGRAIRIWAEYTKFQPQTLFEFTIILNNEDKGIIDISLVDAIGASFNLYNDRLNITGDFDNALCNEADSPYKNYGCLSPCSRFNKPYYCCSGYYNRPETCNINGKYTINTWCSAIKNRVNPPRVYCYAYDDKAGTISNSGNYLTLSFWNNENKELFLS